MSGVTSNGSVSILKDMILQPPRATCSCVGLTFTVILPCQYPDTAPQVLSKGIISLNVLTVVTLTQLRVQQQLCGHTAGCWAFCAPPLLRLPRELLPRLQKHGAGLFPPTHGALHHPFLQAAEVPLERYPWLVASRVLSPSQYHLQACWQRALPPQPVHQ